MLLTFIILTIVWFVWAAGAVLAMLSVRKFARRYERPPRERFKLHRPPAVVIVPFKGLEADLERTLDNLRHQEYPSYRLVCVVESQDDPAYAALRDHLAGRAGCATQILVAGRAADTEGQKVHNLLHAIGAIEQEPHDDARPDQVWVFADSDAVPGPRWLGEMVGPLQQHWITGVTTGYRWMIPPQNAGVFSGFWSHVASILNSSVACFYGYDRFNHAWGGSMAMRRTTAVEGGLIDYFRGALSDDYQVTRLCRDMLLRVYFVPRCMVTTHVDYDRRGFLEFARRQYIITRTHAPWLYYRVLAVLTLIVFGYASATAGLVAAIAIGPWWLIPAPVLAISVVLAADQMRSTYRRRALHNAFGDAVLPSMARTLRLDRWGTAVWMTIHWLIVVSVLGARTIHWRGRRYRIAGPQSVREID